MNIEPFGDDVPLQGPDAPVPEQIDGLLRLLATIRHRFGNTVVTYRFQFGATALWACDGQKQRIAELLDAGQKLLRVSLPPHDVSGSAMFEQAAKPFRESEPDPVQAAILASSRIREHDFKRIAAALGFDDPELTTLNEMVARIEQLRKE